MQSLLIFLLVLLCSNFHLILSTKENVILINYYSNTDKFTSERIMGLEANFGPIVASNVNTANNNYNIQIHLSEPDNFGCNSAISASPTNNEHSALLIFRGNCSFVQKVNNAQAQGYSAAIIINIRALPARSQLRLYRSCGRSGICGRPSRDGTRAGPLRAVGLWTGTWRAMGTAVGTSLKDHPDGDTGDGATIGAPHGPICCAICGNYAAESFG